MSEEFAPAEINPWWHIWVQPRQTIRHLVDSDPKMHFWVLVIFYGLIRAVSTGIQASLGEVFSPRQIAGFILIAGPLAGVIGVFFTASLLELVSRLFGGQAEGQHIRTVLAWATLPMVVLVLVGILPSLAMFGSGVFTQPAARIQQLFFSQGNAADLLTRGLLGWSAGLEIIGSIYFLVVTAIGLAEVQNFSFWKAAGTVFLVFGGMFLSVICLASYGLVV